MYWTAIIPLAQRKKTEYKIPEDPWEEEVERYRKEREKQLEEEARKKKEQEEKEKKEKFWRDYKWMIIGGGGIVTSLYIFSHWVN